MGKPRRKNRGSQRKEDALRKLNTEVKSMSLAESKIKPVKAAPKPNLTVEGCLDRASAHLDMYNYDEAFKCCALCLDLEKDNVPALEMMGQILSEKGNVMAARKKFQRAVELSPHEGYAKYMSLAQIYEGDESVKYFTKGILLMEREKERLIKGEAVESPDAPTSTVDQLGELQSDICKGHLSVAEIYLTDLCDTEDAPTNCRRHIDQSIEAKPNSPEAHQLLASWCISMMDDGDLFEEAKDAVERSVALWLPQYQKATNEDEVAAAPSQCEASASTSDALPLDPIHPCPLTVDDRITSAKILMELYMMDVINDSLANSAVEVLDTVLDEDDENIFVWYLLGWIGCMQGKEHYVNSKISLEQALLLGKRKGFDRCNDLYGVDKQQIEAVLNELTTKMKEENIEEEEEEEEDEDIVDENYETDDEEEED